jgi:hypothetical protein
MASKDFGRRQVKGLRRLRLFCDPKGLVFIDPS